MTAIPGRLGRRPPPALPILVLTGFLGAGKTTLLNGWIRSGAFADAAVVINELGEIGIDHLLVEQTDGAMMSLSSGCICCSVRGDLIDTLEDLIRRRDNGRVTPFNRLVIETTGLADPAPVVNALVAHPYLPLRYHVERVVTVVDALHGAATLDAHREARSQAAVADALVVTKTDLATPAETLALAERLDGLNPHARRLDAAAGQASAEAILAARLEDIGGGAGKRRVAPAAEPSHADRHDRHTDDAHGHDHGSHHHHHGIESIALTHDGPLDPGRLAMFLDLLRGTHGAKLLRLKGLVAYPDAPDAPWVIHGVQHLLHPPQPLARWPDADCRSRLVLILDHVDPATVAATWDAFFGPPAVDRPDAAGLLAGRQAPGGLLI